MLADRSFAVHMDWHALCKHEHQAVALWLGQHTGSSQETPGRSRLGLSAESAPLRLEACGTLSQSALSQSLPLDKNPPSSNNANTPSYSTCTHNGTLV